MDRAGIGQSKGKVEQELRQGWGRGNQRMGILLYDVRSDTGDVKSRLVGEIKKKRCERLALAGEMNGGRVKDFRLPLQGGPILII